MRFHRSFESIRNCWSWASCKKTQVYWGLYPSRKNWFVFYLNNRHQVTSIGNCLSPSHEVCVEVPQGSILGPLLFLIYVNDLPHWLEYCMYADDTVLYYSGKSLMPRIWNWRGCVSLFSQWYDFDTCIGDAFVSEINWNRNKCLAPLKVNWSDHMWVVHLGGSQFVVCSTHMLFPFRS